MNKSLHLSILLAENVPEELEESSKILRQAGYTVHAVTTGKECLEVLEKIKPDLVLLGMLLRDSKVQDICYQIKQNPSLPFVHILLLTSVNKRTDQVAKALEKGADGSIVRPVNKREFLARIDAEIRLIQAQKQIRLLSLRTEAILASVPDIIMEVDTRKIYTWANYAGIDFFGKDVLGKEAAYYFEGEQKTYDIVQPLFNGNEDLFYVESWQRRKDGEKRLLAWWCRVTKDSSGNVTGALSSARDITYQHQIEEKLAENEKKYTDLYENAPDMYFSVDVETATIRQCNRTAVLTTGFSREELIGSPVFQIYHPDCHTKVREGLTRFRETGEVQNLELLVRRKNGSKLPVMLNASAIRDDQGKILFTRSILRDITARKLAEESLAISEEKFSKAFHLAPYAVTITRASDGMILDANDSFYAISGYSREEIAGKTTMDLKLWVNEQDRVTVLNALMQGNKVSNREFRFRRKNGEILTGKFACEVITIRDEKAILSTIEDITNRKQAEAIQHMQYNIARGVVLSENLNELFEVVRAELSEVIDTTNFFLAFYDEKTGLLTSPFEKDEKDSIPEWPAEKSLTGLVIWQKKPLLLGKQEIQQLSKSGNIHLIGSRAEIWLGVPLILDSKIIGAIVVQSYDNPAAYNKQSIVILETIASQLSFYINYKRGEEALRISEQRFKDIFSHAPAGIYQSDREGNFLIANQRLADILGYESTETLLKRNLALDIYNNPDERAALIAQYEPLGSAANREVVWKKQDGSPVWVSISAHVIRDLAGKTLFFEGFVEDISQRKKGEEQLRESQILYRSLFDNTGTATIIVQKDATVVMANEECFRVTGYRAEELVGTKWIRYVAPESLERMSGYFVTRFTSSGEAPTRYETKLVNAQGEVRDAILNIGKIPGSDLIIVSMIDITDRRRAEEQLQKAKEKAEESDRLKSAFLANMSHEIRTPMNAIVGFAGMLTDETLTTEEKNKFSTIIQSRSDDLMHIINDLLEISRIESGAVTLVQGNVVLNHVLDEMKTVFHQRLQKINKTGLSLFAEKSLSDKESTLFTDRYIVKQVFSNLIDNAIKYTPSGSIRFGYFAPAQGMITCYVRDTGIGISAENQAIIFEHFRQADIEDPHRYGGTGLGLSICKGSLTLLGGTIRVESAQDAGTTFFFTIPFTQGVASPGEPTRISGAKPLKRKFNWGGKRILLVEDEETNIEYIKIILLHTQAEVVPVDCGKKLRDLYGQIDSFDLILLDIRLPDANGYELVKEIKAIRPALPIIAQTAYAMSTDQKKSEEAGCDNYISKPIRKEQLLELLADYLEKEVQKA
jgi:PAS domain S-box-containing protein